MATEFEFPDVGEGVTEGTLLTWLVEEGDEVAEDESLAEVETDKAVVEVPAPEDATILELHAAEGDTIHVGDVIVTLGEDGESTDTDTEADADDSEDNEKTTDGPAETEQEQPADTGTDTDTGKVLAAPATRRLAREKEVDIAQIDGSGPGGRVTRDDVLQAAEGGGSAEPDTAETASEEGAGQVLAAPATRKLARELGVDITQVDGSGPDGRVTQDDVRQAAEAAEAPEAAADTEETVEAPEPAEGTSAGVRGGLGTPARFPPESYDFEEYGDVEREELSSTRKAIGKNMERSKYTAPHVTATDDADVTELWDVREKEKEVAASRDIHLTFLPFIVKATVAALESFPRMNASLDPETGELVKKDYYHIGIAVATDDGLMVPNIKDADEKSILQIAKEMNELAEQARNHELDLADMRGGTFTITNYGSIGGKYGTPILNYPEVGILGTGTISKEPVVKNGDIHIRRILPLSVSFDHRVVDGAYVARFMNELIKHLEDPDLLLLDAG